MSGHTYGYNEADWLTGVRYPDNHAVLYGLGGDGTRVGEKEVSGYVGSLGPGGFATAPNPTKDWTYGFDNQGGLLSATRPEVQPGGGETQVQVASWTTDAAGRVTHSVTPEGTRDFGWSARDTLGQATSTPAVPGGEGTSVTVSYGYDGDGLRRSRTVSGDSTGYLWAEGQLVEERLPGNDVLYANVAGMAVSANADRLAHDGLGSVVGLVGATRTTRKYDAWGGFLDGTAPTSAQPSLAYAGQAWDVDSGLSYAQQRWYDEATGRFLSMDPVGITSQRLMGPAGLNVWAYVSANPVRFLDPAGEALKDYGLTALDPSQRKALVQALSESLESKEQVQSFAQGGDEDLLSGYEFYVAMPRTNGFALTETVGSFLSEHQEGRWAKFKRWLSGTGPAKKLADWDEAAKDSARAIGARATSGLNPYQNSPNPIYQELNAGATKRQRQIGGDLGQMGYEQSRDYVLADTGGRALGVLVGVILGKNLKASAAFKKAQSASIQSGEVTTFEEFVARSTVGDNLEGHELWQHANLKANELATERLSTIASKENPVIALDRESHKAVNAAQRELKAAEQTPMENIEANASILRRLQVATDEQISTLERWAKAHAKKWGF